MIAYHWAPCSVRESIKKHGLLVPTRHPKLTTPTTCSEGHRNPHLSLARNPADAWRLSGGFLVGRSYEATGVTQIPLSWDLWQVDLHAIRYRCNGIELQCPSDILKSRLTWIGYRGIT